MRARGLVIVASLALSACGSTSDRALALTDDEHASAGRICITGDERDQEKFVLILEKSGLSVIDSCLPGNAELVAEVTREDDGLNSLRVRIVIVKNGHGKGKPILDLSSSGELKKGESEDACISGLIKRDEKYYISKISMMHI